jgi:hemoglobin-like flavoprotein
MPEASPLRQKQLKQLPYPGAIDLKQRAPILCGLQDRRPAMRPDDIALVRSGFAKLLADRENFTTRFYGALFRIEPRLGALFGDDLMVPAEQFVQALGLAVTALDDFDSVREDLQALGRRHVDYGVENRHYGIAGEALLDALEATLGDAFDQRARAAWAIVYAHLADVMSGADDSGGHPALA